MKWACVIFVGSALLLAGCGQKGDRVKLEEGTPVYELAKDLAGKLPYLDPETNNLLATSKYFEITTGEVIQFMVDRTGKNAEGLRNLNPTRLKNMIMQTARELADARLLQSAAQKAGFDAYQTDIDSVLAMQYSRAGGQENFVKWLEDNGMRIDFVKADIQRNVTIQRYLDYELADEIAVDEDAIQEEYQRDKTATVRHVLLLTQGKDDSEKQAIREKTEGILARARRGEDFAELAKEYSEDPGSKDKGGLYEDFGRGFMVKPFEDVAFSLPIGQISDIVETAYGYHIIKVVDRKKETRSIDEVRPQIAAQLSTKKKNNAYQTHLARLKEDAELELIEF